MFFFRFQSVCVNDHASAIMCMRSRSHLSEHACGLCADIHENTLRYCAAEEGLPLVGGVPAFQIRSHEQCYEAPRSGPAAKTSLGYLFLTVWSKMLGDGLIDRQMSGAANQLWRTCGFAGMQADLMLGPD